MKNGRKKLELLPLLESITYYYILIFQLSSTLPDENEQRYVCGKEPDKLWMAGGHSKFRANMHSIHGSGLSDPVLQYNIANFIY